MKSVRQKFQSKANTDLKDQIVRELQASYLYQAYVSKVNANLYKDLIARELKASYLYQAYVNKANADLYKDLIVRELQASYLHRAYVRKVNADLKANMNGDILLQTTAIFFLSNLYLKQGIG